MEIKILISNVVNQPTILVTTLCSCMTEMWYLFLGLAIKKVLNLKLVVFLDFVLLVVRSIYFLANKNLVHFLN